MNLVLALALSVPRTIGPDDAPKCNPGWLIEITQWGDESETTSQGNPVGEGCDGKDEVKSMKDSVPLVA